MQIVSTKNAVLLGFTLSLISVAFNSIVISYVDSRLKAVDDEATSLTDSLVQQGAALAEGDSQYAIYRVLHNLEFAVPPGKAPDVQPDAANQLRSALEKWYQSAYDIPQTEMTEADVEDFGQQLPVMEKSLSLVRALQAATSPEKKAQLIAELDNLQKQLPEPKTDLIRKLRELQKKADDAESADSEVAIYSTLLPLVRNFQAQTVSSSEKKRSRIRELQDERASLVRKSKYSNYGAIAFQLLGLMLILAKDLLDDKKSEFQ